MYVYIYVFIYVCLYVSVYIHVCLIDYIYAYALDACKVDYCILSSSYRRYIYSYAFHQYYNIQHRYFLHHHHHDHYYIFINITT